MKVFQKNKKALLVIGCFISLLIIWELAERLHFVPHYILPPFSEVVAVTWGEIVGGKLLVMLGRTLLVLIESLAVSL